VSSRPYSYSYAGGPLLKASLGYPGSAMQLKVQAPDGQIYTGTGPSPIVVVVNNAPAGIYKLTVIGVSGLGAVGEERSSRSLLWSRASALTSIRTEPCVVLHGAGSSGCGAGVRSVQPSCDHRHRLARGAIVTGTGTYNGVGWTGSVLLVAHSGVLDIIAVGGTVFGVNVPAQQIVSQIGSAIARTRRASTRDSSSTGSLPATAW